MDPVSIATLASGAAAVGGNLIGAYMNRKATEAANAANAEMAQKNIEMQERFAQHGVRWKVADAQAAGIHPLYALGANTHSFSPVSVGAIPDHSMGQAMANIGQDIGRAIHSTSTVKERQATAARMTALTEERAELENALLRSQIAKINQAPNPPLPSNSDMPALTGQGNSTTGYVREKPLERVHSQPGRPAQEVGAIPDYGFSRTNSGLTPVPSKDIKEKIEDQFIPETMWALRNQLLPNFGKGPLPPDPKYYPLPPGATAWKWNHLYQEFQPFDQRKGGWVQLKGGR